MAIQKGNAQCVTGCVKGQSPGLECLFNFFVDKSCPFILTYNFRILALYFIVGINRIFCRTKQDDHLEAA